MSSEAVVNFLEARAAEIAALNARGDLTNEEAVELIADLAEVNTIMEKLGTEADKILAEKIALQIFNAVSIVAPHLGPLLQIAKTKL